MNSLSRRSPRSRIVSPGAAFRGRKCRAWTPLAATLSGTARQPGSGLPGASVTMARMRAPRAVV
ncbi:hypothetical protein [Massilia oculi]|uniref:hypothetical protein n=1 Tax=Massilia oculi TaxID=945844 RepID=UPI0013B372B3|nr:hypothetical protein [Massilia oculi]